MLRRVFCLVLLLAAFPACARAAGQPNVAFDGGTAREQTAVRSAFAVGSFPWQVLRARVVVHIEPNVLSHATPGEVWLDSHLLDAGRLAWGVVQHEFAHQIDFFLLDDAKRSALAARLGGRSWWNDGPFALAPDGTAAHAELTAERFASTLTWAYWPSRANILRPERPGDEAAALPPREFRALLASVLGDPGLVR